jgi:hypothetical protein
MFASGGPTNVQTIYFTSHQVFCSITGVTVHKLQLLGDAVCPHLAPSFGTPSALHTPIERYLKRSNLMIWEAM